MKKKTFDRSEKPPRSISVGECLDQLFNRDCLFPFERDDDPNKDKTLDKSGGLVCPSKDGSTPGTGNIVIKGSAGTGKSTLALQIAVEAARRNINVNTAYISLEETPQHLLAKARMFGWQYWLTPLRMRPYSCDGQPSSRDVLQDDLKNILEQKSFVCPNGTKKENNHIAGTCTRKADGGSCEYHFFQGYAERHCEHQGDSEKDPICGGACGLRFDNHVLLPSLEARVFEPSDNYEKHDKLFRIRMDQLEDILHAACKLNDDEKNCGKRLDIVCIDSLNVLGQGHLTRDHLSSLFDLFRRYRVIGVFVYEQLEHENLSGRFDHSLKDIEFLADTVIDLTGGEYQGYWVRHLHISKSRHQHQVLGRHPFKIVEDESRNQSPVPNLKSDTCPHLITTRSCLPSDGTEIRVSRFGIRVFPSIHTVIRSSNPKPVSPKGDENGNTNDAEKFFFQDKNLNNIGGPALKKHGGPAVATVYGPPVTGKSVLAFNFLLQCIIEGKNGILITLGETCTFNSGNAALGSESANAEEEKDKAKKDKENILKNCKLVDLLKAESADDLLDGIEKNACRILRYVAGDHKVALAVWCCKPIGDNTAVLPNYIIEMVLKPGALLPEEVASLIRHVYGAFTLLTKDGKRDSGNWPKRAVLQNVNRIGFAYPFLRAATTGPELFLPGLTHLFHCRGTDLLITAQTGGVEASDNITKQAIALASDAALECSHLDVFGDRYVTITGPGLIENDTHSVNTPEGVPGVLILKREKKGDICSFIVNMDALSDLVGFAKGDIRRPGVLLQLFEEGGLHKKYNHQQVKRLVQFAMGDPMRHDGRDTNDMARVQIDTFDSREASAFHRSLSLLRGAPLSKTVIRTVDEFAYRDHVGITGTSLDTAVRKSKPSGRYENVYYRNVLLFLCDNETYKELETFKDALENTRLCIQLVVGFKALKKLVPNVGFVKTMLPQPCYNMNPVPESSESIACNIQALEKPINSILAIINNVEQKDQTQNQEMDSIGELKSLLITLKKESKKRVDFPEKSPIKQDDKFNHFCELFSNIMDRLEEAKLEDELHGDYRNSALKFWKKMEALTGTGDNHTAFLYDERARETFASLALDGILSLAGRHRGEWDFSDETANNDVVKALRGDNTGKPLSDWITHLTAVLKNAIPLLIKGRQDDIEEIDERKNDVSDEAKSIFEKRKHFVLLAWYSQIRELVDLIYQDKALGSSIDLEYMRDLKVFSLPAGGVKGDWYLQVPQGSVSISLGRKIRRQMLEPTEDLNRFMSGVGLPCWPRSDSAFVRSSQSPGDDSEEKFSETRFNNLKRYSEERYPELLKAWPGSEVTLQAVLTIHRFAHRRSDIIGYEKIHDELFAIMDAIRMQSKIIPVEDIPSSIEEHEELMINVIKRLKTS